MVLREIRTFLYYTLRILHNIVNNVMAIPAYCVWYALLYPLRKVWPQLYWRIENVMFKALMSFVVQWTRSGGYKCEYGKCFKNSNTSSLNSQLKCWLSGLKITK